MASMLNERDRLAARRSWAGSQHCLSLGPALDFARGRRRVRGVGYPKGEAMRASTIGGKRLRDACRPQHHSRRHGRACGAGVVTEYGPGFALARAAIIGLLVGGVLIGLVGVSGPVA